MVRAGYNAAVENSDALKKILQRTGTRALSDKEKYIADNPMIAAIDIIGNEALPFKFLYRLLGFDPGDFFEPHILEQRISEMYSLGYFNTISYDIITNPDQTINLNLLISEKSLRELNTGIRWDNLYGFVGTMNVQINSTWFPGLVIEDQVHLAGIRGNILDIYYPSRTKDFPLYPFFRSYYENRLLHHFDYSIQDKQLFELTNYSIGTGFGLLMKNYWSLELELKSEQINFIPKYHNDIHSLSLKNKNINSINVDIDLDILDDVLLPSQGIKVDFDLKISEHTFDSNLNFTWYALAAESYLTVKDYTLKLFGLYQRGIGDVPIYQKTIYGGSNYLVGFYEDQICGQQTTLLNTEIRYKYKKDIYFRFLMSNIVHNQYNEYIIENLGGFGVGVTLTSPIGPLEFVWSTGPEKLTDPDTYRSYYYFNAGYKF